MPEKQRIEITDGPSVVLENLREHYNQCSHASETGIYEPCPRCALHRVVQSAKELNVRAERAKGLGIGSREIATVLLAVLAEQTP